MHSFAISNKNPFKTERRPMERYYVFVGTFIVILFVVQAQNQTGFISVDCGLSPRKSPYNEHSTGLTYTSDADLVSSGKTGRIAKEFEQDYNKPTLTLRYFPDGVRNCYNLNVTSETNYLIRATFVYGNYDSLNFNPNFDLYFGPNLWTRVTRNDTVEEIIHVTKSNSLQVCLVKTGISIPFINVLELRPLTNDVYVPASGSLRCLFRKDLGISSRIIRYPNDIYDRIWHAFFIEKSWTQLTTTMHINDSNIYRVPQAVMGTAVTPLNANATLNITLTFETPNTPFYFYLHSADLQNLQANDTREIHLVVQGETIFGPYSPKPLRTRTTLNQRPGQCQRRTCLLQLVKTPESTLPPLLNAIEAFTVIDFPQMETNGDDVYGIKNVQDTYGLSRISWQGDPCVPKQFVWDGLNCNTSDSSTPPVITSLNLSSSGLTGIITQAIQNLTHLQNLDLSNNNLTGKIPEFLSHLESLLVINLSGNNFSGLVPPSLLQKKGMQLNVDGNPHLLRTTGSSLNTGEGGHNTSNVQGEGGHKKKSITLPVVTSIALITILIGAL